MHPHHRPGAWVPHVTLATALTDLPAAIAALGRPELPLPARLDRLEVVAFPPPRILASHGLAA